MKVTGSHQLRASRKQVWDALQDPAVLVRTIPGCRELEEVSTDTYVARVHAGVASITGTYDGRVVLSDQDPPSSYALRATGSGDPGTIDATATVRLIERDDGTEISYDADAVIGGAIAGVGQRVVAGVAQRNAADFFDAVDRHLTAGSGRSHDLIAGSSSGRSDEDTGDITRSHEDTSDQRGVHVPSRAAPTAPARLQLLAAALAGAAVALLGVAAGRRIPR